MERKNYLVEELSKKEKAYLKSIVLSVKNSYLKRNWNYIYGSVELQENMINVSNNLLETLFRNYEEEMKSISEFENLFSNIIIYKTIKALSLKEKMVLFLLYKENKSIAQISSEMGIRRETVWRIKNKAQDKILKNLLQGGTKNV